MSAPDPPEEPPSKTPDPPAGIDWAAAGVTSAVTLAMTGNPIAAAVPLLAPALKAAYALDQKAWEGRSLRAARTLEAASSASGHGLNELCARVVSSDARTELLGRVLDASSRTINLEMKVEALGEVLAMGLWDDAKFDEAILLAEAFQDLENPHVRVLSVIEGEPPQKAGWNNKDLANALPELSHVLDAFLSVLSRHALAYDSSVHAFIGSGPNWQITELGKTALRLLRSTRKAS